MSTKINDYLEPFKNYHICNNKLYNIGELLGIRNYIHIGNMMDADKLWLSYKYKTIYDDKFINNFTTVYELPFKEYSLNRIVKHWKYDSYGNLLSKNIMKPEGQLCPWKTNEDIAKNSGKTKIQELIGCNLEKNQTCSGFCTFPSNGELNTPSGIIWNLSDYINENNLSDTINSQWNYLKDLNLKNNNETFIIPSASFNRYLYANSDIEVFDDLEINFTKNPQNFLDELNSFNNLENLHKSFRSIYQGFGGFLEDNVQKYPRYLETYHTQILSGFTLAKNTPFNGPHIITNGTLIYGWDYDKNNSSKILPSGYFAIFRVKNWWSNSIKCTGTIKAIPVTDLNTINMPLNLSKVLQTTSKYDYVERMYGFFKYQQENLHKSNIYSIKIANSGLNPENDEKLTYYQKNELITILETNNYYNKTFKYIENEDKFYNTSTETNPEIVSISFDDMYSMSGWNYSIIDKTEYYYRIEEEYKISQKNKIRKNIRDLLENAIRNSVIKYMPVDTTLWKIMYTGK